MGSINLWRPLDFIGCHLVGKRFVGAQSVEDVLVLGSKLKAQGYKLTYNLLGEHVSDAEAVKMALKTTLDLIRKIDWTNHGSVSCKPTLYGLFLSKDIFTDIIGEIIECAYSRGVEVEIDTESFCYVPDTFAVFNSFASNPKYRHTIRQAIQAHLKSGLSLMDEFNMWDKKLRVVKGSGVYKEDPSVVLNDPLLVRDRYIKILTENMKRGRIPLAATVRDRNLAEEVIRVAGQGKLLFESLFEFQMLHGPLGRKLRKNLLSRGYPVRIYVPFTDWWCRDAGGPYILRRAQMGRRLLWEEFVSRVGSLFTAD